MAVGCARWVIIDQGEELKKPHKRVSTYPPPLPNSRHRRWRLPDMQCVQFKETCSIRGQSLSLAAGDPVAAGRGWQRRTNASGC